LARSVQAASSASRTDPDEERRLIGAARRGDRRALDRLARRLAGPAYRYGRTFCGDAHDAEDVRQDVMAALVRSLQSLRGEASLTTWAYVVARHACARRRRRRAGAPRVHDALDERSGALEVPDPGAGPEREVERRELHLALRAAISALPPTLREVILLRDVEGLPAERVARVLRVGERAVKSRLHRARVALRARLQPQFAVEAHERAGCPDTARMLSRFLEGELDGSACARLEAHVAECGACGATCETLRHALGECRAWGRGQAPPEIRDAVRDAVRAALGSARTAGRIT
jgi:RNA polymerase sigma-70 factor (ECF subfamily)